MYRYAFDILKANWSSSFLTSKKYEFIRKHHQQNPFHKDIYNYGNCNPNLKQFGVEQVIYEITNPQNFTSNTSLPVNVLKYIRLFPLFYLKNINH